MTDKQIIIDGVDVSECTRYCADNGKCTAFKSQYLCSERNNCYTKRILKKNNTINILKEKLLRKEQECEELKVEFKLFQQLKDEDSFRVVKLSSENVKLKHQLDIYKQSHKTEQDRRRAFEQTLEEIRKIAKENVGYFPDGEMFARPEIEQIINKINEVIDEEIIFSCRF